MPKRWKIAQKEGEVVFFGTHLLMETLYSTAFGSGVWLKACHGSQLLLIHHLISLCSFGSLSAGVLFHAQSFACQGT